MQGIDNKKILREARRQSRSIKKHFIAGENITVQSAVYLDSDGTVKKFDSTNLLLNRKCLGITTTSAVEGQQVCVVLFGEVKFDTSPFTEGDTYYAVENGNLDILFPVPGLIVKVGIAISDCLLFVDIDHQDPQGDPLNIYIQDYTVSGAFDGVNIDFQTTAQFVPGTLGIYLNGVRMYLDDDYIITGPDTFQMTFVPNIAGKFLAEYIPI